MAQMTAVTVRAARTNIIMGALLRQRLPCSLTDGDCSGWRRGAVKRFAPRDSFDTSLGTGVTASRPVRLRRVVQGLSSRGPMPAPHLERRAHGDLSAGRRE